MSHGFPDPVYPVPHVPQPCCLGHPVGAPVDAWEPKMTFTYGPGSELGTSALWPLPPPSLEAFPKRCWLRGAGPHCLAAGYLHGNVPGARREGKGPGLAQLILASVGRKLGAGGSPGFPRGRGGYVSFPPSPRCVRQITGCRRGEGSTERAGSGTAHTAQHLPPAWAGDTAAQHGSRGLKEVVGQCGGGPG